jgi:hypothetical protein
MNESNPSTPFFGLYKGIMEGEQMPPLYFYLLYFIFKVFGYTTFIARLFSATLGVLSVFYIYKLGKELISKNIGLLVALLLAINSFHIYYSQDARPYILLLLFTQISFYRLILFLKENTIRNAVYYGVFTGLMIISHFFGLFVLLSQLLIFGLFFLLIEKNSKIKFLKNSLFSGLITFVFFIPAITIFIKVSQIKEFWIPAPTSDVYTLIYKEFFGNSEMIMSLISVFILLYFIKLTKEKDTLLTSKSVLNNKYLLSFFIIFPWVSLVLLIPLIRSYLTIPMIISRYFIVVLPALLLIISIGIAEFKNKIIQISFISLLVMFTFSDVFFVKKYYNQPNKSQFREAATFVLTNNTSKDPIYTTLLWHFNYFFNSTENKISDKSLDAVINDIKTDSTKLKPFWYINAHGNKYEMSKESEQFILDNYIIEKQFDGYDAWAKRFVPQTMINQNIDIIKYKPFNKNQYGQKIKAWVDNLEQNKDSLKIAGWSILEKKDSKNSHIYLILLNQKSEKIYFSNTIQRPDITRSENNGFDYNNSGFELKTATSDLEKGTYKLGIYIINDKEDGFFITEKQILIN